MRVISACCYACVVVVEAVLVVCDAIYACLVVVEAVLVVCDGSYACVVVVEALLVVCVCDIRACYWCMLLVRVVMRVSWW